MVGIEPWVDGQKIPIYADLGKYRYLFLYYNKVWQINVRQTEGDA